MALVDGFSFQRFVLFITCSFASVFSLLLALTSFVVKTLFWSEGTNSEASQGRKEQPSEERREEDQDESVSCRTNLNLEIKQSEFDKEEEENEESPKLFFKFQFQTYREHDIGETVPLSAPSVNLSSDELVRDDEQINCNPCLSEDSNIKGFEGPSFQDDYKQTVPSSVASVNLSGDQLVRDDEQNNCNPCWSEDSNISRLEGPSFPDDENKNLDDSGTSYSEHRQAADGKQSSRSEGDDSIKSNQFLTTTDLVCDPEEDESPHLSASSKGDAFLSEADFEDQFEHVQRMESDEEDESFGMETEEPYGSANADESDSYDSDEDSSDILWEQQDFLEQLKLDLKKVRSTGLPTISEEDEYPKVIESFAPWKLDDKFRHEDRISELNKFNRIYKERMRKLDILNYQKRIAVGYCQSIDMHQTISRKKGSSAQAFAFLFPSKAKLGRSRISASDSIGTTMRDLHVEFETVYVAQMCLSWEILHWQYEKVMELWEYDHLGIHNYTEVAGEYQQFQVLLQRFLENERFDGPRVEYYTSKRHSSRKLLQVPVIREDRSKNRSRGNDAIKSDQLIQIMQGSIRTFWKFVKADPKSHSLNRTTELSNQIDTDDPATQQMLSGTRNDLIKKQKRFRELTKNRKGCMYGKSQKQGKDNSDHALSFFSEVDMKLVSRVLNMSKITTDQLLWCRSKLESINFMGRQIQVEPTFCLFPS